MFSAAQRWGKHMVQTGWDYDTPQNRLTGFLPRWNGRIGETFRERSTLARFLILS